MTNISLSRATLVPYIRVQNLLDFCGNCSNDQLHPFGKIYIRMKRLRSIFAYGYKEGRRNQLPPRGEVGRHGDPDRSPDKMAVADRTLAMPLQGKRGGSREEVSVLPAAQTTRGVS